MAQEATCDRGSRGLGLATCERLAASGAEVIAVARDTKVLEEAVSGLAARTGGRVSGYACDMAREEDIRETWARIAAAHGGVDILVNNAGTAVKADFPELARRFPPRHRAHVTVPDPLAAVLP